MPDAADRRRRDRQGRTGTDRVASAPSGRRWTAARPDAGTTGRGRRRRPRFEVTPAAALAQHLEGDGALGKQAGHALQVRVEPPERRLGHAAFAAAADVPAGADTDPHRCAAGTQRDVVVEHLRTLVVLPAVDEQRRHVPACRASALKSSGAQNGSSGSPWASWSREQRQILAREELDRVTERQVVEAPPRSAAMRFAIASGSTCRAGRRSAAC